MEEMRSGIPSSKPKDIPFYQALNDPETRTIYIRRKHVFFSLFQTIEMCDQTFKRSNGGQRLL
jgi:hypothetical protein